MKIERDGYMKGQISKIFKSKKLIINDYLISVARDLEEVLVLVYLDNNYNDSLDIELMSKVLDMDTSIVMESFNNLTIKNLVSLDSVKDIDSKVVEKVNLEGLYSLIYDDLNNEYSEEKTIDIYKTFERELGRTISSKETEIIDGWLNTGTPEELILGALREAIYNGAPRFRYIDQIIYEWEKKGFKTMDDVSNYMKNSRSEIEKDEKTVKKEQDILEFDWINNDN